MGINAGISPFSVSNSAFFLPFSGKRSFSVFSKTSGYIFLRDTADLARFTGEG